MTKRFNRPVWDRRSGQRGFTLIELLVVIAVLAVLAVVVLFNVTGVKNKGQSAGCQTDVKTIQTAVDAGLGATPAITPTAGTYNTAATIAAFLGAYQPTYIHNTTTSCNSITVTADASGGGFTVSGS